MITVIETALFQCLFSCLHFSRKAVAANVTILNKPTDADAALAALCARAYFCSLDETHEPPNGYRESTGRMLGCACAILSAIQYYMALLSEPLACLSEHSLNSCIMSVLCIGSVVERSTFD